MNLKFLIPALLLAGACQVRGDLSVSSVLEQREKYVEKSIALTGVVFIRDGAAVLCDTSSTDVCINLAVPRELMKFTNSKEAEVVTVYGTYLDHEYSEHGNEILFLPSRFIVDHFERD